MSDNFVLSPTERWMVRIIQVIFIVGILAVVWFGRGDMDMFDSSETAHERLTPQEK